MLAISGHTKICIELVGYLTPLLGSILSNQFDQFLIFSLDPVALLNRGLFILIEFILALGVIPARYETSNLDPIILPQLLWSDVLTSTILLNRPQKQLGFLVSPILLGVVRFLALQLRQLVKDFRRSLVRDGILGTIQ